MIDHAHSHVDALIAPLCLVVGFSLRMGHVTLSTVDLSHGQNTDWRSRSVAKKEADPRKLSRHEDYSKQVCKKRIGEGDRTAKRRR